MSTYHSMGKKKSRTKRARRQFMTYQMTSDVCEYMVANPDIPLQQVGRYMGLGDSTIYNWFSHVESKRTANLARWLGTSDNYQRLRNARPRLAMFNTGQNHNLEVLPTSRQEFAATWETDIATGHDLSVLREEALTVAAQAKSISIDVEALVAAIDLVHQWSSDRERLNQTSKLVISLQDTIAKLESEKKAAMERLVRAQSTHSN